MARKPVLNFSHSFSNNIWKIHAFEGVSYLVLEIRNQDGLQVSFAVIDLKESKIFLDNIVLEESWWISVADLTDKQVVFYTFDADKNPEVKEYLGYDINDKEVLWKSKNLPESTSHDKNNSLEIPFYYQPGTDYFKTVEAFIQGYFKESVVKAVNYLERDNEVLISYFSEAKGKLVNKLLVMDKEGDVLLTENLGVFDNGISDNTFFIINNTLIFVKGVTDFFMYDLNP